MDIETKNEKIWKKHQKVVDTKWKKFLTELKSFRLNYDEFKKLLDMYIVHAECRDKMYLMLRNIEK